MFRCECERVFAAYATRAFVICAQRQCKTQKQKSPNFLNTPDLCSTVRNVGEKNARSIVLHFHVTVGSHEWVWACAFIVALCVVVSSLFCCAAVYSRVCSVSVCVCVCVCVRVCVCVCVCVCLCVYLVERLGLARRRCAERAVGG